MKKKIMKLINDPFGVQRRRISSFLQPYKYWAPNGYRAEKYWTDRLSKYGFYLRGVANAGLSHTENAWMYLRAKEVFLRLCRQEGVDFKKAQILDIGCGTGFYAKTFLENGGKQYLGIDITDVLFNQLRQKFPEFQFRKLDISIQELNGNLQFDLIVMIDVTQHIKNDDMFSFAMQNIRSNLSEGGILIVTSQLSEKTRHSFYEVSRSINAYEREFPGYVFNKLIPFREKFIFLIWDSKLPRSRAARH